MKIISWLLFLFAFLYTATSSFAMTLEAEDAKIKTTGVAINDGWNLWANGMVGDYIRIQTAGTYKLTVRAYGSPLEGIWPLMSINVDGLSVDTRTVDKSMFTDFIFQVEFTPGVHPISFSFLNDAHNPGVEDRNLYLDKIEIRPVQGLEEPIVSSEQEWALEAKILEDTALQKTEEAIKKNRMGSGTITVLDDKGNPMSDVTITVEQIQHDFLFGCTLFKFDRFSTENENLTYKKLFRELFNYATLPFYWPSLEPEQGKPNFTYLDKLVAWCRKNGIRMKGHPLLWDNGENPGWSDGQPSPEIQEKHVVEVLQRYRGKIEFWEVVNEPAHLIGISIDHPYSWARKTSPEAYLIVNDFGVLADGYPPFFDLLKDATRNGVPFDGIGIQAHSPADMAFPLSVVQNILDRYATLGKDLHITEFTPASNGRSVLGSLGKGIWNEARQAEYAEKFYRLCFAHPAVSAITWWNLSDRGSFRENGGMLRSDLTPKPVYETLRKLIHDEWHTKIQGKTNELGSFKFLGFYGLHRVILNIFGTKKEEEFYLINGKKNNFVYNLDMDVSKAQAL